MAKAEKRGKAVAVGWWLGEGSAVGAGFETKEEPAQEAGQSHQGKNSSGHDVKQPLRAGGRWLARFGAEEKQGFDFLEGGFVRLHLRMLVHAGTELPPSPHRVAPRCRPRPTTRLRL